jgi:tetratricopeptide (TPR) repeat protein
MHRAAAEERGQSSKGDPNSVVIIKSNVRSLAVSSRKELVGNDNTPIKLASGSHHLELSANGYVTRYLRLEGGFSGTRTLTVNLQKKPASQPYVPHQFLQLDLNAGSKMAKQTASVCSLRPQNADFSCVRIKHDEDVVFSGIMWLDERPFSSLDEEIARRLKAEPVQKIAADAAFVEKIETLWQTTPGSDILGSLLARLFYYRGQCDRIGDILLESQGAGLPLTALNLLSGLCFERMGKRDVALAVLEKNFEKLPKDPAAFFHRIRLLMPNYRDDTLKLVASCRKEFPSYYPCYDLWAVIESRMRQSTLKVRRHYIESNEAKIREQVLAVLRLKKEGRTAEALELVRKELKNHALSFELVWLWTLLESKKGVMPGIAVLEERVRHLKIIDRIFAGQIINEVMATGKHEYGQLAYRSYVREFPKEPENWLKLIKLYEAGGACDKAVIVAREAYTQLPERAVTTIRQWEGGCLVKLGKLDEALKAFTKIAEDLPESWNGFYNMAVIHERRGASLEAYQAFKKAGNRRPPPHVLQKILEKIEFYNKKLTPEQRAALPDEK